VHGLRLNKGITVIDVFVRLDNPDKFFAWVVEVEFNLVGGRTDGFITSELKLFNEILVGVLCHTSALIGIKENVINVKRSCDEGLSVSCGGLVIGSARAVDIRDSEKAFIKRSEFDVDLDFVILKSNKGKCETGVTAEPELKRDVKSSFWKSTARGAYGFRD